MTAFSKHISSRSTLFGFLAVVLLSVIIVVTLLVQLDSWNGAAFNMVKNNTQQVRLVLIMRDVVQRRELTILHMINKKEAFERDAEAEKFYSLAGVYADARERLMQTTVDERLLENLKKLDEAVSHAQPFHNNLMDSLVFEDINSVQFESLIQQGRKASGEVLRLLDQIIEGQNKVYETTFIEYEESRQYALLAIACAFVLIAIIVVSALRATNRRFKYISRLSIIDDVSGTYNRRYFDMVLEEEWRRSMREYTSLSLLMVDIDYFKAYNDSYGHQMGDVCLFTIGKILSGQLKRATDFTARYGGEEFVIVLPNTSSEHARLLGERLRRSVEEARIEAGNDEVSPWVTVSIGVATTTAEYDQPSSVLVKAADNCLYESKRNGRNRVTDSIVEDLN